MKCSWGTSSKSLKLQKFNCKISEHKSLVHSPTSSSSTGETRCVNFFQIEWSEYVRRLFHTRYRGAEQRKKEESGWNYDETTRFAKKNLCHNELSLGAKVKCCNSWAIKFGRRRRTKFTRASCADEKNCINRFFLVVRRRIKERKIPEITQSENQRQNKSKVRKEKKWEKLDKN